MMVLMITMRTHLVSFFCGKEEKVGCIYMDDYFFTGIIAVSCRNLRLLSCITKV